MPAIHHCFSPVASTNGKTRQRTKQTARRLMKNTIRWVAPAAFLAGLCAFTVRADEDLRAKSREAVANFLKADSTLRKFISDSAGYAVFPNVGKGGFIVGGARGKGLV